MIILVLGVASGVAVALALDLVATTGAVFASQMAYSQTLAGIAWGMLLLGEQLPAVAWGAFGISYPRFLVGRAQAGGRGVLSDRSTRSTVSVVSTLGTN